jgi:hypothetical protein
MTRHPAGTLVRVVHERGTDLIVLGALLLYGPEVESGAYRSACTTKDEEL